jgi:signal transduction histidine kinase
MSWQSPFATIVTAAVSIAAASAVWWLRVRRLTRLRSVIQNIHTISEQILGAGSSAEIQHRLEAGLGPTLKVTSVGLYRYDREGRRLEHVGANSVPGEGLPVLTGTTTDRVPVVRAFEELLVVVNDVRPGSICVPMVVQDSVEGVMELGYAGAPRTLDQGEQAALQHLANQAAIALKLLEQRLLREQILRSEKLGAAGQLISGVAQELRTPLEFIMELSAKLLERPHDPATRTELESLAAQSARASEVLARLVSFGRGEQTRARPLPVNALLRNLMEFREQTWHILGITATAGYAPEEPMIVGAQGQLEQALLSLLLHAEESLAGAEEKRIELHARQRGNWALIEIDYTAQARTDSISEMMSHEKDEKEGWGLAVCRGIVEGHGGEIRHRSTASGSRFEVELPLAQAAAEKSGGAASKGPGRPLSFLLAEPEMAQQRQLLTMLSARGHRVVPSSGGTEALDLIQRLKTDVLIASSRLPDMAWVELMERSRRSVGAFVRLADGYEPGVEAPFGAGEGYVLRKPVDDEALDTVLAELYLEKERERESV